MQLEGMIVVLAFLFPPFFTVVWLGFYRSSHIKLMTVKTKRTHINTIEEPFGEDEIEIYHGAR